MLNLSKRLQLVASFVPDNTSIIDVGCDHALLSIYLYKTLKKVKIMASDINPNPLKMAKDNLKKYNLEGKITLKEQDGIKDLPNDVDTIIIAGMGGILISKILNSKDNLKNIKNIILSPNNDFPLVRETLTKLNFQIVKEQLVIDNGKTYLVLKAILNTKKLKKIDYFFGTLNNKSLETIYYYTNILNTNTKILKSLPKKYLKKRFRLKRENKKIKKFLLTK